MFSAPFLAMSAEWIDICGKTPLALAALTLNEAAGQHHFAPLKANQQQADLLAAIDPEHDGRHDAPRQSMTTPTP